MTPLLFFLFLDLRGRVVDAENGQPIRKAIVSIPGHGYQSTDANGKFLFSGLAAGGYQVSFQAREYNRGSLRPGMPLATTRYCWIDERNAGEEFTARLGKAARVSGKLENQDGDPVSGREVLLLEESEGRWIFASAAASGADGHFEFYGLRPGRYAVGTPGKIEDLGMLRAGEERSKLSVLLAEPSRFRVEFTTPGFGSAVWLAELHPQVTPILPAELTPQVEVYPTRDQLVVPRAPAGNYLLRAFTKSSNGIRTLFERPIVVRGDAERRHEEAIPLSADSFPSLSLRLDGVPPKSRLVLKSIDPGNITELEYWIDQEELVPIGPLSKGNYLVEVHTPTGPLLLSQERIFMPATESIQILSGMGNKLRKEVRVEGPSAALFYHSALAQNADGQEVKLPLDKDGGARFWLKPGNWKFRLLSDTAP